MKTRILFGLLLAGLLFTVAACGNKGPLELPDEDDERSERRDY